MVHNLVLCSFFLLLLLLLFPLFPGALAVPVKFSQLHRSHQLPHHAGTMKASSKDTIRAAKTQIQMVTTLPDEQEARVSGPNPGGNSHGLESTLQQKPVAGMAVEKKVETTPVSGPISRTLDTIGPNPGGNSQILAANPNTQTLTASSGPNPGGNSAPLSTVLDTLVSGPNPGGNSLIFAANPNSQTLAAISGPRSGGNSASLATMLDSAVSGPNPGGNSQAASSDLGGNSQSMTASSRPDRHLEHRPDPHLKHHAVVDSALISNDVLSKLPRAPVPPSGPSHGHNSDITQERLFAARKLIGCEDEEQEIGVPLVGEEVSVQVGSLMNSVSSMGVASLSS